MTETAKRAIVITTFLSIEQIIRKYENWSAGTGNYVYLYFGDSKIPISFWALATGALKALLKFPKLMLHKKWANACGVMETL